MSTVDFIRSSLRQLHNMYDEAIGDLSDEQLQDRKSTRLNSSHIQKSRMPSSA